MAVNLATRGANGSGDYHCKMFEEWEDMWEDCILNEMIKAFSENHSVSIYQTSGQLV